jgi:hypothetical protein
MSIASNSVAAREAHIVEAAQNSFPTMRRKGRKVQVPGLPDPVVRAPFHAQPGLVPRWFAGTAADDRLVGFCVSVLDPRFRTNTWNNRG